MNGLVVGLLLVGGLALCLYLYGFINQSINLLKAKGQIGHALTSQ